MGAENKLTHDQIKEIIRRELPSIVQTDPDMEQFVLQVTRKKYADKEETADRFDRLLLELKQDREEQRRKWDLQNQEESKRWEDQNQKWREQNQEQSKRWDEQNQKWHEHEQEQRKRWDEQNQKWHEQNQKWWENQKTINAMLEDIRRIWRRIDVGIDALGARWGIRAEGSFRDALKGILEDSFAVRVERYVDYDPEGKVFGKPDQVELDILIRDGTLILCELKSSISKSDMYTFLRKIRFYEEKHGVKANRRLVISPMVEERAKAVAAAEGIEVYGYPEDIQAL